LDNTLDNDDVYDGRRDNEISPVKAFTEVKIQQMNSDMHKHVNNDSKNESKILMTDSSSDRRRDMDPSNLRYSDNNVKNDTSPALRRSSDSNSEEVVDTISQQDANLSNQQIRLSDLNSSVTECIRESLRDASNQFVTLGKLNSIVSSNEKEIIMLRNEISSKSLELNYAEDKFKREIENYQLMISNIESVRQTETYKFERDISKLQLSLEEKSNEIENLEVIN
jgi:hypothetical protein